MPKKPLVENAIEKITGSSNKLDINFLIMSYDGAENYTDRWYKKEILINFNKYIHVLNKIEDSFVQEKLDNSELYKKFISKEDYKKYLQNEEIIEDMVSLRHLKLKREKISLHNKNVEQNINKEINKEKSKKENLTASITKLEQDNLEIKENLNLIKNIEKLYKDKTNDINLDNISLAKRILTENNNIKNYTSGTFIEGITFLEHTYALVKFKDYYK
jgi:hypothetical protein